MKKQLALVVVGLVTVLVLAAQLARASAGPGAAGPSRLDVVSRTCEHVRR